MSRTRFILSLLLAAAIGFALGWVTRPTSSPSVEAKVRAALTDLWNALHRD